MGVCGSPMKKNATAPPLEPAIKAALVDRLRTNGVLSEDAIIINEFPVDGWSRRADLVVVNSRLHVFEIKSEADNLTRLLAQMSTYERFFDKVTLVCGPSHIKRALEYLEPRIEIIAAEHRNEGIFLRRVRRGTTKTVIDKQALLQLMTNKEITSLLSENQLAYKARARRKNLIFLASHLRARSIHAAAIASLKIRYSERYLNFVSGLSSTTQPEDLRRLQARKITPDFGTKALHRADKETTIENQRMYVSVDTARLAKCFGVIPDDLPKLVRARQPQKPRSSRSSTASSL